MAQIAGRKLAVGTAKVVAGMCALLAGAYVAALLIPWTRRFFALTVLDGGMIVTVVLASAVSIGALALCGFTLDLDRAAGDQDKTASDPGG